MKKFVSIISIVSLSVILFQNCEKKVEVPDEIQPQSDVKKAKPVSANIDSLSTV